MRNYYLVTGASSGIGACFARELAARGNNLVLVARNKKSLDELARELIDKHNIETLAIVCDLSNRNAVLALIDDIVERNIYIAGLINNAGFGIAREFTNTSLSEQSNFLEVCVNAPTILCHAFLPMMKARGYGRIINVSSIVAFSNGAAGHTLYPAAKSYILKMSQSLAAECEGYDINILALCPGPTESDFQNRSGMAQKMGKRHRMKTMKAQTVVFDALKANESKKEVLVPGLINKLSVLALKTIPQSILSPLIRGAARKFLIE